MSADVTKSVCSSAEPVHKTWKLQLYMILQRFVSRRCSVYVLVGKTAGTQHRLKLAGFTTDCV